MLLNEFCAIKFKINCGKLFKTNKIISWLQSGYKLTIGVGAEKPCCHGQ